MSQSLQCPRCNGSVTIADDAAGQRVKCPHCQQHFLAPGIAATINDDDDWLSLDEPIDLSDEIPDLSPPPASTFPSSTPTPQGSKPQGSKPGTGPDLDDDHLDEDLPLAPSTGKLFGLDEEALLAEFTGDMDDFAADMETPPPPAPPAPGNLPASKPFPAAKARPDPHATAPASPAPPSNRPGSPAKPEAEPVEYASEYRVTCNVCGSFLYCRASQAGKTVKCPDCHSPMTVPPPPKVKKKFQVNLDEVETFSFEANPKAERRPDPYQKSANELLEEAEREDTFNPKTTYDDTPSVVEWLKGIFLPFKDPSVLVHLLGLCVLACVPTLIVLKLDHPILVLGLFPGGFFLALLTVSCGFAILQSVANDEPTVSDWPTLDPMGWVGQLFLAGAALTVAAIPVWAICMMIIGPQLLSVAITMFSIYVLFPFVLLSMLDMNSAFIPFSSEVARSITKCEEAWGGFYFSSGALFIGLFLIFATASAMSPASGAVLAITCAIAAAFLYFGMIGRLAYSIGQAVNAPPRHDEVDRTRQSNVS